MNSVRGKLKRNHGFSLVEVMISLTLSAVLAGGFSYWFFVGNQERYFSRTSSRIQDAQEDTYMQIQKVLNEAIRVTGFTKETYPGVSDSLSSFTNQENLKIYRVHYPEITVGISNISLATSKKIRFKLTHIANPAQGDPVAIRARQAEEVLSGYLSAATVSPRFVAFYKGTQVNILPVKKTADTPSSEDGIITGIFEADLDALPNAVATNLSLIGSEIDETTTIAMAEETELRLRARGELVLVEKFPDPTIEKLTLIQTQLDQLLFGFSFGSHQRPAQADAMDLIVPDRPLERWDGSDYHMDGCNPTANPSECCDPSSSNFECVNISDLATVRITMTMSAAYTGRIPKTISGDRVRLVQGRLYRDGLFSVSPSGYGLVLNDEGAPTQDTECLDPKSRCGRNPECSTFYNDPNPNSPRWLGYGQYKGNPTEVVSNYCDCGTGPDADGDGEWGEHFIPPETPAGMNAVPYYAPPFDAPGNRQINACISHYGDVYGWAWKHPMMWFDWNAGIRGLPANIRAEYRTGSFPNFEWHFEAFDALRTNLLQHPDPEDPDAFWDDRIDCRLNWDYISGEFRKIFWMRSGGQTYGDLAKVTQPNSAEFSDFGSDHAKDLGVTKLLMVVEQKCACNAQGSSIVPKYVCNHAVGRTTPYCSNTWEQEPDPGNPGNTRGVYLAGTEGLAEGLKRKVYRVNSSGGYTKGLSNVNQAALCQCLNETYNPPHRDSSNVIPGYEGWAVSNIWDWRVDPSDTNWLNSISNVDGSVYTSISGTTPLFAVAGLPVREQDFSGHKMRAQNSPHVRTVKVNYTTANGGAVQTSQPIRCDTAWRGYLGRCTQPMPAGSEKDNILANLTVANPGLSADQREAYAGYCSQACFRELGAGNHAVGWYSGAGVRALRQALTNVATPEEIPTWCGGGMESGEGIF